MCRIVLLLVVCAVSAGAQNLLRNASFESFTASEPTDWKVFVQPKYDAASLLDQRVAKDGANSVRLSIETPYAEDPANNWSQNILDDQRGKSLSVKGYIKTEKAGEAAIWLQCYRKSPLRVILQESSTSTKLITGTMDWTPVDFKIRVPADADFLVVRCVLRGQGTAWFDALTVEVLAESAATTPAVPSGPVVVPSTLPEIKMPTPPTMPEMPKPTINAPDAKAIIQAHDEMRKANEALLQSNEALNRQIDELRKQIDELKKQVSETSAEAKRLKEEQSVPVERERPVEVPAPPLVPGEDGEAKP